MSMRRGGFLWAVVFSALACAAGAQASTYRVFQLAGNSGLEWTTVSAAWAQAVAAAGDHTIQIEDTGPSGTGYTEARMDLPASPLGNITVTATVATKITASGSGEVFRNLCTAAGENVISVLGLSSGSPITLSSSNSVSIMSCEQPNLNARTGRLRLENVVLEKSTSAPTSFFLRIDSRAAGQQYLKNVTFSGGSTTNTNPLMQAGSGVTTTTQDLYMEFVSFASANGTGGMLRIQNKANIEAKNCTFKPASGVSMPCVVGTAVSGSTGGSTVVFRDCQFQSVNGSSVYDAFQTLGETFQTTRNLYKLYRPQFFNCGTNIFAMDDRPCEVQVLGLDDSDQATVPKTDLSFVPTAVLRYARLRGNNKLVMTRCFASDDLGSSIKSIGAGSGALVGNPEVELNNCDFKGTGIIAMNASGGAFGPIITMNNCLYQVGLFALPFIATDGSNTAAAQVTLNNCTLTRNSSVFFTANAADLYYGPGTIFDGSNGTSIANFALQASAVPSIAWTSLGTSGFTSVPSNTIVANPQLASGGHLTSASTVALAAATGSTVTSDIDDNARPLPAGSVANDIGADETSFPVTNITLPTSTVADNAPNGTVVSTFTITDPDQDTTLTLTNNGGGAFGLSGNDLIVADNSLLNGVTTPIVGIAVDGTDLYPATVSRTFNVNVTHPSATVSTVVVQDGATVRVTFSRAMGATALDAAKYTVSGTGQGTFTAQPDSVTAHSATEYDLTWNAPAEMFNGGDITITADTAILDAQGVALAAPTSATDLGGAIGTAPALDTVSAVTASPTNADDLDFSFTFNESVQNFDATSVEVTATGTAYTGVAVSGGPSTYTVTVQGVTGDGSISVALAGTNAVADLAGNATGASALSAAITVDNTGPALSTITLVGADPTNADDVSFIYTFDEPVQGFDASSVDVSTTGTAYTGVAVSGGPSAYTVTVQGISGDGSVSVALAASNAITDLSSNPAAPSALSASVAIDNTSPQLISVGTAVASPTNADDVAFTFSFDGPVAGFDASNVAVATSGTAYTGVQVSGGPADYTVTVQGITGDGTVSTGLAALPTAADAAGNAVQPSALSASVTEDNTPPVVLHVNVTDANPTNAPNVHYSVQFSENVTGFDSSACAVTATAGTLNGASVALVLGTGDVYTVRVARGTGNVSFRLDINASPAITDAAGNALVTGYTTGDVYTIEELRITQDLAANASAIVGETVHFAVTAVGGIGGRTYTWLYSETPGGPFAVIPGATGDTYDLVNASLTDSGYYYLSLSDTYETVTSTTQHLTVNNGVPVAGIMGMLALAGAIAGIAARAQKRK